MGDYKEKYDNLLAAYDRIVQRNAELSLRLGVTDVAGPTDVPEQENPVKVGDRYTLSAKEYVVVETTRATAMLEDDKGQVITVTPKYLARATKVK